VLFGGLARSLVDDGANVFANLSNDGWFQHEAALEQHLAAAIYRAIETRRPMLRATRTGITASIDAEGRVLGRLPVDVEGVLKTRVIPGATTSPYVAGGHFFPWVAAVASVALAIRRSFPSHGGDPPVY
jgi:apolipoprotein N-acyltransferase